MKSMFTLKIFQKLSMKTLNIERRRKNEVEERIDRKG
jgi:hypothetical protein